MQRSTRRLVVLALALVFLVMITAVLYQAGMARLEGKPRSFWAAVEWAGESLSTTGYGADARWTHPLMVAFVVAVQFIGVFLVFLIIPIYLVPFLEERFEEKVPRSVTEPLDGHVIVFRFGPAVESLLTSLGARGIESVVVETDEPQARALMESGQRVVFTRNEEDVLDICRLSDARALVANGKDQENAALVLRARQAGFTGAVYAFVEEPQHRKPMELAGATAAYTPRHIVAASLAAHASERISPRLPGLDAIAGIERREVRLPAAGSLIGRPLHDLRLPAAIVGIWSHSKLHTFFTPGDLLEPNSILELAGETEAIEESAQRLGGRLLRHDGVFIIGGFGEVGRKIHELLTDAGEPVRVIERHAAANVDVVGDVLDISVLERAGIAEARAVLLALDSDDSTLFATVIVRDVAPDVAVIARVNHARNLADMHRAGADYAQSISDISGQMLSARLLGRDARAREEHRRVVRVEAGACVGQSLREVAAAGGRTLLAVEHDGELVRRLDPDYRVEATDRLWLCTA